MIHSGRNGPAQTPHRGDDAAPHGSHHGTIRFLGLLAAGLTGWALWDLRTVSSGSGSFLGVFSLAWAFAMSGFGVLTLVVGAWAAWTVLRPEGMIDRMSVAARRVRRWPASLRLIGGLLLLAAGVGLLVSDRFDTFQLISLRLVVLALVSGGLALTSPWGGDGWRRLALAGMGTAALVVLAERLALVSDFPFSLGWSEGNRLWDYSLLFARYGYPIAGEFAYPSYLTPGRHGLWGLAFLIPGASIQLVRLWDAILWTAPYLVLGLALVRRRRGWGPVFGLWSLLFLSQGPIYAPLVLSAIVLALGYDGRRPLRSAGVVALACFYAGISRWTWLVAPALWAALWALADSPHASPWLRRIKTPVVLGMAGLAGAIASQLVMRLWFAQPEVPFATTARQALLWYRLLPSATNPHGILPALAVAVGPILVMLGVAVRRRWLAWDGLQVVGAGAVLVSTLAVGLAASVKIGGGNNLHNLDMFLVSLVFVAAMALAGLARGDRPWPGRAGPLVALMVVVPIGMTLAAREGPDLPGPQASASALHDLTVAAQRASGSGPVLFIDQRQLFPFGHLDGVALVLDYELKDLMNQAMGNNRAYLDRFEADLAAERFSMIVVDPLSTDLQGRERAFGEENDAWVRQVAGPILMHYQQGPCLEPAGVCLYTPRR